MRHIKRTFNRALIKAVYGQNNLYNEILGDDAVPFIDWLPNIAPDLYWLVLFEGNRVAGLIRFDTVTNVCFSSHVLILPEFRGKGSENWGKLALIYMRETVGAKRFITMSDIPNAVHWAKKCGFKEIAVLKESVSKNGNLKDQVLLERN